MEKAGLAPMIIFCLALAGCATFQPSLAPADWGQDAAGRSVFTSGPNDPFDKVFFCPVGAKVAEGSALKKIAFQLEKRSGSPGGGYGFIWAYKDKDNFYRALVSAAGTYKISQRKGGKWSDVTPWTATTGLISGLGRVARVEVEDLGDGRFRVLLNKVPSSPFYLGGSLRGPFAYYAYIGSEAEERGVKRAQILFKMLEPESVNPAPIVDKIQELSPAIDSYPPRFKDAADKDRVVASYLGIKKELDAYIAENGNDQVYLYLRARLQAMGHNMDYAGAWKGAVDDFNRAIALNPLDYQAVASLGFHLVFTNNSYARKAQELFEEAQRLYGAEPYQSAQEGLFFALLGQSKWDEALGQVDYLVERWPQAGYERDRDIVRMQRQKAIENTSKARGYSSLGAVGIQDAS